MQVGAVSRIRFGPDCLSGYLPPGKCRSLTFVGILPIMSVQVDFCTRCGPRADFI